MPVVFFDRQPLVERLNSLRLQSLSESVQRICSQRFLPSHHGKHVEWLSAWQVLPEVSAYFDLSGDAVRVVPVIQSSDGGPESIENRRLDVEQLRRVLMQFHPWRKGPLEILKVEIDTEWRSSFKWRRFANQIDFRGKRVLDIGSGNGYYGWKMLEAGASLVVGCDPVLLSVAQFEVFRKYWPETESHWVIPLADSDLPRDLAAFDLTFSMGVLYHRPNPIDHLQILHSTLKPGGHVLLETLIIQGGDQDLLMPEDRYAKMRNVWFIPSLPMLERWLRRTGFADIRVLDVTRTTTEEQRGTEWMTFESLADFLDPTDPDRTIEGHPAPTRAILLARRSP